MEIHITHDCLSKNTIHRRGPEMMRDIYARSGRDTERTGDEYGARM
ncbi:MAG: hypothetical protein ACOC2H_05095 [Spirochaetota bacterium]